MKTLIKFIFPLVILFYSIDGYSQINKPITKGNIILGGAIGFSCNPGISDSNNDYDDSNMDYHFSSKQNFLSFSLSPSFGYFVADGFVLGLSPSFSYFHNKYTYKYFYPSTGQENEYEYKSTSYRIGLYPITKYYFKNCIFIELITGFSRSWSNSFQGYSDNPVQDYKYKNTSTSIEVGLGLGYAIFITPKISIEPGLFYIYNLDIGKQTGDDYTDKNNNQSHNISLSAGFHFFL
jgi:long-subunit fatty acid transport protein